MNKKRTTEVVQDGMSADDFKRVRNEMNMTHEQLAHVCELGVTTISRWERGVAPIRQTTAILLLQAKRLGLAGPGPRQRGGPLKTENQRLTEKESWERDLPTLREFLSRRGK